MPIDVPRESAARFLTSGRLSPCAVPSDIDGSRILMERKANGIPHLLPDRGSHAPPAILRTLRLALGQCPETYGSSQAALEGSNPSPSARLPAGGGQSTLWNLS